MLKFTDFIENHLFSSNSSTICYPRMGQNLGQPDLPPDENAQKVKKSR